MVLIISYTQSIHRLWNLETFRLHSSNAGHHNEAFVSCILTTEVDRGCCGNGVAQLVRALAMLVLLGVPWVFSAFGAIDSQSGKDMKLLEGVFQVSYTPANQVKLK